MEPRGTTQGPLGKLPRGCTGGDPQPRRCGAYSLVRIGNHPHPPSIQTLQHSASEEAAQGPGGRGGSFGAGGGRLEACSAVRGSPPGGGVGTGGHGEDPTWEMGPKKWVGTGS